MENNFSDITYWMDKCDRLTAQLAEAKSSAKAWQENCRLTEEELEKERDKHADIIGKLAERDGAITCYNEVLAELREEVATLRQQSINWVPVFDENMVLQTENAALRGEVERLKNPLVDAPAAYENGYKQAAQEILVILRADRWAESDLAGIKAKFGLEG